MGNATCIETDVTW